MTVVDGVTAAIHALCQRRGLTCNVERKVCYSAAIMCVQPQEMQQSQQTIQCWCCDSRPQCCSIVCFRCFYGATGMSGHRVLS